MLRVVTPSDLTEEQKRLFHEIARSFGKPVNPPDDRGIFDKVKDMFGA
jgi:DnaJ-class molecular chaperone